MSRIVFVNKDKKAMRALLKEYGVEANREVLKREKLEDSKPISIDGFYLEFEVETKDFILYYQYPSGYIIKFYSVLGSWNIPVKGWEKVWIKP